MVDSDPKPSIPFQNELILFSPVPGGQVSMSQLAFTAEMISDLLASNH